MNKVFISGTISRDPIIREYSTKVANFSIACPRGTDKGFDYVSCVAFDKTADIIEKKTAQGTKVVIEGKVRVDSYEKDGKKVYQTNVVADRVELLEATKEVKGAEVKKMTPEELNNFINVDIEQEGLPFD